MRPPAAGPTGEAAADAERTPRVARARARAERLRARAEALATRTPGYAPAAGALSHDRLNGGGLLAGALAFRLFGALLPLALLMAIVLGYAASQDAGAPREAGETIGIAPALLQSVGESSKLSAGTRWSVTAFAVIALLWSATSAARAIRAVHSLAWDGRVGRFRRPVPAALVLLGALACLAAVIAGTAKARADLGFAGLVISVLALGVFFAIWMGVEWLLPHGEARWTAPVPGAVLFALGIEIIHLGTVLFIADRVQRASDTYGSLGVAFTILFWLFVVSRVIVASAMLNAALARRGPPGRAEVVGA
jgi:uncharacterized BrkB/YihY/UPF0761 family membrane protein